MGGNALDLQGQKGSVDMIDVGMAHRAAEAGLPARADDGVRTERFDVLPLAEAHRPACLGERKLEIEGLPEGVHEDLGGSEGAEIDGRAGPIEDHCFESMLHGGVFLSWEVVIAHPDALPARVAAQRARNAGA